MQLQKFKDAITLKMFKDATLRFQNCKRIIKNVDFLLTKYESTNKISQCAIPHFEK